MRAVLGGKAALEVLLAGGVPETPPHWELVFQIPKEMFGLDPALVRQGEGLSFHMQVCERLIHECGWAAVPPADPYSPEHVAATKEALGEHALVPGYEGSGVFWMPSGSTMMDFVVKLFEDPAGLHQEARGKCDAAKERLSQLADAGADFFVLTYDFGFNDAPFVSPAHFRDIVTPYLAEIVARAHELGKVAILHSDGCLTKILAQIHSTGVDGYQSIDPQGHMDISEVRAEYPDWLLMGNVACNLMQDTDEVAIRGAVDHCMLYGGVGKRYILSTSNCIFAGMPPASYRVMLDEYAALCAGPLR